MISDFYHSLQACPLLKQLEPFTEAYIEAALVCYPSQDTILTIADIHQSAMSRIIEDCQLFREQADWSIQHGLRMSANHKGWTPLTRAGFEFWHARNGDKFSRAFWYADTAFFLTRLAKSFGNAKLYISQHDGLVYQSGAEDT